MSTNVLAIGLFTARTNINFVPRLERDVTFTIVNSEAEDIKLSITAQGELAEYVFIETPQFEMKSDEYERELKYTVRLPDELTPGLHTAEIVILQLPEEGEFGETFVAATVALATQLHVVVPSPGKYAEATINIIGPGDDGKMAFVIPVESKGEFDLANVKADIEIFTSLNEKIESLVTNEVSIPSGKRREIVAEWDVSGVNPGPYFAIVTLRYDEKTLRLDKEFNIGSKRLTLVNIEVDDFSLGEIAKFEVLIKNEWTQKIEGAFIRMQIFKEGGAVLADFKSPTYDVAASENTLMIMFWDTEGVKEKVYDAEFSIVSGKNVDQKAFEVDVRKNEIIIATAGYVISRGGGEGGGLVGGFTMTTLIIVVIVLVLVNLSWFIFLRKKFKKKVSISYPSGFAFTILQDSSSSTNFKVIGS